ncbi:MAG: hypothetical protein KAQ85_01350 [Thermodesulfovibrionia bacterium]|nr:hypothetical protein [Thermodesulfovibrionia bacterium]
MNDDVRKLLNRIEAISQIHDIRLVKVRTTEVANLIQDKSENNYLGDIENTLLWLLDGIKEAQKIQDDKIQESFRKGETWNI